MVSCFKFQLEKLWADILTCVQSRHCGPYNSDLLAIMSPLLVICNKLHSSFNHFWRASFITPPLSNDIHIILILELCNVRPQLGTNCFLFTGGDVRSSKKKYKESCRHVLECLVCSLANLEVPRKSEVCEMIFFCNCPFWMYSSSYFCLPFPFPDQFFRLPKKKCHLLCQAGKTSRYHNAVSLFQSNLKIACC